MHDRRSYGNSKLTAFLWCDYGIGCYCLRRIFQKMPTIQVGQISTTHHSTIVTVLARLIFLCTHLCKIKGLEIFSVNIHTWIKVDVIPLTVWWPALEKQRERGWGDWRWHSRTCNGPSSSNVNTKHKLEDVNHLYVHYLFIQFCNAMKVHSASNAVLNFYVVMTTAWATVVDPILISLLLTVKHQRFFDSDCSILLEQLGVGWRQIKNSFSCICTQQKFTS